MPGLKFLIDGLVVGESPRWHDGRLWFCNWGAQEIRTIDPEGNSEVVARGPKPAGYCIDFLPDGRLLVTGADRLLRREPDGSFVTHVDLGALGKGWNEVTVDARGRPPGEQTCLSLVWAVLDRASTGWRGIDTSVAGIRRLRDLHRQLLPEPELAVG